MTPHATRNTTAVLGAPSDWDESIDGVCEGLPVTQVGGTMISYWRPTWRERLALIFGRSIKLGVVGSGHPPVSLNV